MFETVVVTLIVLLHFNLKIGLQTYKLSQKKTAQMSGLSILKLSIIKSYLLGLLYVDSKIL